ncbi:MAG: glycosyltransferase family 9 protein [Fibrobacterota bacterium]
MLNPSAPNVLIWRNGKLGNTIAAVPFILELRKALPHCRIGVVVETLGADLLANYPEINQLIIYNKRGDDRGLGAHLRLIKKIREEDFSHTFLLKRFFRNSFLSFLAGIHNRYGFAGGSGNRLLTRTVPYREDQNIVMTNLSLLSLLGLPVPDTTSYRFYTSGPDQQDATRFLESNGLKAGAYAVFHCGGQTVRDEAVPAGVFAGLARILREQHGLTSVFINCRGDETMVSAVLKEPGLSASAPCFTDDRIRVNAELLRRAKVFIGSNSGQAHLAALVGTPSLVLYRQNERTDHFLKKWMPWQERAVPLVVDADAPDAKAFSEARVKIEQLLKG